MVTKALTSLLIMALVLMPIYVLSAGIENSNMQMKMQLKMSQVKNKAESKCMHQQSKNLEQQTSIKTCCDQHSNQCKSCNNCPPVVSAMVLTTFYQATHPAFKKQTLLIGNFILNGTSQKNLLKPPRNFI